MENRRGVGKGKVKRKEYEIMEKWNEEKARNKGRKNHKGG